MSDVVLDVRGLSVAVPSPAGMVHAVRDVSFQLSRGQRLGLVGESGSGKTLTALATMNLLRPPVRVTQGSVVLNGHDVLAMSARRLTRVRLSEIAMVYQDPLSSLNPVRTIGTQLAEGLRLHRDMRPREARQRAVELLSSVGVPHAARRVDSYPHEFSGGMRQRVMIAMAVSLEPAVLIADEPTTALDVTTQARIVELLHKLVEQHGMGVVLVTHDLGLAASFCSDIAVMYAGRIVDRAPAQVLYDLPLHPYSEALLGSVPRIATDPDRPLPAIGGQPPLPAELPGGCPFNPRCPYVLDVCREQAPPEVVRAEHKTLCHRADERAELRLAGERS
jgi:oligopeptide/dipeptide ABC transporter ATP-binding protein